MNGTKPREPSGASAPFWPSLPPRRAGIDAFAAFDLLRSSRGDLSRQLSCVFRLVAWPAVSESIAS